MDRDPENSQAETERRMKTDAIALAGGSTAMTAKDRRAVALWLLLCCAMIFAMVVLGGVTRLTHSGLSMVEWKPVTGFLPPMSESAWEDAFAKYRQYPEYREINAGMTLEEFKSIFWLEFIHRVWGRTIGVVFLLPFLYFLVRKRIDRWLAPRLALIFVLGALQGVMGWYMVKSGLVDRPDVSHYRLTAHLLAAFAIYGYILWVALSLLYPGAARAVENAPAGRVRGLAWTLFALVSITVASGGLVAGLDAGFAYNTFPLMDGRWIPEDILKLRPLLSNLFDNPITVQFDHRVLAVTTATVAVLLWFAGRRADRLAAIGARARLWLHGVLAATAVQVALGLTTLLTVVALVPAAAHQAGALVLFTAVIGALHALREAPASAAAAAGP